MVPDAIPLHTLNDPATEGPTLFRLYVSSECTRSEGWRGELTPAPEPARAGQTIDTPMGPFEYRSSAYAWGQHGWFPQAWPAPQMGAGHWPCG